MVRYAYTAVYFPQNVNDDDHDDNNNNYCVGGNSNKCRGELFTPFIDKNNNYDATCSVFFIIEQQNYNNTSRASL